MDNAEKHSATTHLRVFYNIIYIIYWAMEVVLYMPLFLPAKQCHIPYCGNNAIVFSICLHIIVEWPMINKNDESFFPPSQLRLLGPERDVIFPVSFLPVVYIYNKRTVCTVGIYVSSFLVPENCQTC